MSRGSASPTRQLTFWLLMLCCNAHSAQTSVQPANREESTDYAETVEALSAGLDELRRNGKVPAMGLAIFDEGRPLLLRTFGTARPDTPFRWGSITKSFTGLAALQLTRLTEVQIDTPIRKLLGDGYYVNDWASEHPVRLGDLLSLSAGFADLNRAEWADTERRSLWQALDRFATERRTLWPPGLQHSYSNVPPGLTAAAIERASGQTFEAFVTGQVFEPLGMKTASLEPVTGLPGGFQADGRTTIPYWHVTFAGFGALNASTSEMSRFVEALLNDGLLDDRQALPAELVEMFFQPGPTLATRAGLEVGYGSGVYGWVRHGHLFHGHGGDADGYRSRYGLLRDHGRGYLLVINTDNPKLLGKMRRHIEKALTRDLADHRPPPHTTPAHANPSQANSELASLAGTYYPSTTRFGQDAWQHGESEQARVEVEGGRLQFYQGERSVRLTPAGQGRFYRDLDPAVTVVFARDSAGTLYLQGELGDFVRISPGPCPDFLKLCE